MEYAVLIWDENPEQIRKFIFPVDPLPKEFTQDEMNLVISALKTANNHYLNGNENDEIIDAALETINVMISDPTYATSTWPDETLRPLLGKLQEYEDDLETVCQITFVGHGVSHHVISIYVCGFYI